MNRLEKKCFVTVSGAHALMFLILFIGPGFFMAAQKPDQFHEITVYSAADISMALKTDGGTPQDVRAIPAPPPPVPIPAVAEQKPVVNPTPPEVPEPPKQRTKQVEPVKPEPRVKPVDKGDEPTPLKQKKPVRKLDPSELVSSVPTADTMKAQRKAAADAKARAALAADEKRRADDIKAFGNGLNAIKNNLSGSTLVKMPVGGGGGGAASVNYRDLIASKFYAAWNPSFSLDGDTPDVTISITITRDGRVTGHITKRSGNSNMDRSVQNALDTVTYIAPFPDSFSEQSMTVPVIFNLQAKRQ